MGGYPDSQQRAAGRKGGVEIEAEVRAAYGSELDACALLHEFGEDALCTWPGRPVEADSVDPIIVAEGARATKTYGGELRLVAGGFGPQGSMLNRSLFEGMAIAHWAHAHPDRAVELFTKHGRHSELLWGDAFEKADPAAARQIDAGTPEERRQFTDLFGRYGTKLWTAHPNLYRLLPDIEEQWTEGESRDQLWWYFRVAHRDNNQVLHSTALGLSSGVTRTAEDLQLDAGPSELYLDRALLSAFWCYSNMLALLWDHFEIPDRQQLDEVITATMGALDGLGRGTPRRPSMRTREAR